MRYFIVWHIELDPFNKILTFGYSLQFNTYATTFWLQQWWYLWKLSKYGFTIHVGRLVGFKIVTSSSFSLSWWWSVFVETASVAYRITNLFIDSSIGLTSRNLVLWPYWFICFVLKALLILTPLDIILLITGSCCEEIFGPGFIWWCIGSVQMRSKHWF